MKIWFQNLLSNGSNLCRYDEDEVSRTMMRLHTHPLDDERNAWAAVHPPSFSRTVAIPVPAPVPVDSTHGPGGAAGAALRVGHRLSHSAGTFGVTADDADPFAADAAAAADEADAADAPSFLRAAAAAALAACASAATLAADADAAPAPVVTSRGRPASLRAAAEDDADAASADPPPPQWHTSAAPAPTGHRPRPRAPRAAPVTVKHVTVDLIPGGRDVAVTDDNRKRYVELYARHRMETVRGKSILLALRAIRCGLTEVIPAELLTTFTPLELERLVCGMPKIDVAAWREATSYEGRGGDESTLTRQAVWLWWGCTS